MPSKLPRPLLDALLQDRVLPVVGAGFSLNARLESPREMPMWTGLGEQLESEVEFLTPRADAVEVVSAYAAEHGRQALIARLRDALHDGFAQPGDAHSAFVRLPFDVVVTTNFDSLLEDAYRDVQRPLRTLIREDQFASLVPRSAVALVKAHGDFDNEPVLVATEEDYDEFLLRRPILTTYLGNLLITRVALLVGYSLTDPDWRQLLAALRTRLGRSQQAVYALEVDAAPATVERFRRRGVTVVNLQSGGRAYTDVLIDAFEQMRAHISRHALDASVVRDEGALEELRSAPRGERRLCLFLLPERTLAYYREQVFPVLRDVGIQPVTSYDVDSGSAPLYATAMALMDEAAAIVVDVSGRDTGTGYELGLALSSEAGREGRVAVVAPADSADTPPGPEAKIYFFREEGFDPLFPSLLAQWVTEVLGPPVGRNARAFPTGVTQAGPDWQVVRAYRDLELALAARLDRHVPMSRGLREAAAQRLISHEMLEPLVRGYRLRNEILHRGRVPTLRDAEETVATVREALEALSSSDVGPSLGSLP